jgi:hypothetical protein
LFQLFFNTGKINCTTLRAPGIAGSLNKESPVRHSQQIGDSGNENYPDNDGLKHRVKLDILVYNIARGELISCPVVNGNGQILNTESGRSSKKPFFPSFYLWHLN